MHPTAFSEFVEPKESLHSVSRLLLQSLLSRHFYRRHTLTHTHIRARVSAQSLLKGHIPSGLCNHSLLSPPRLILNCIAVHRIAPHQKSQKNPLRSLSLPLSLCVSSIQSKLEPAIERLFPLSHLHSTPRHSSSSRSSTPSHPILSYPPRLPHPFSLAFPPPGSNITPSTTSPTFSLEILPHQPSLTKVAFSLSLTASFLTVHFNILSLILLHFS